MAAQKLFLIISLVCLLDLASLVSLELQERGETTDDRKSSVRPNDSKDGQVTKNKPVCSSEVCKDRAHLIKEYINTSADPCDDFYSYVCKKWTSKNMERAPYDAFQMLREQFIDVLKGILEEAEIVYNNQTIINKAAVLYNACLAVPVEEDGRDDLLEIMNKQGLADWPIIINGNVSGDTFDNVTEVLLKVGMESIIQFFVGKDSRNSSAHGIKIYPLGLISSIDRNKLNKSAKFVNSSLQDSDVESLCASLTAFQQKWTNLTAQPRVRVLRYETTIGTLEKNFTLPLLELLNREFNKTNILLDAEENVEVYSLDIYMLLDKFLQASKPVDLFNYIGYMFVVTWGEHTFLRTLYDSPAPQGAWRSKQCAGLVHNAMKDVTSSLYAKKKFTPEAKSQVEKISVRLKEVFNDSLQGATWMDTENKMKALQKLQKMVAKIGYSPWLLNTTVLQHLYKYVPSFNKSTSFLKMMYLTNENNDIIMMERLRQEYDTDSDWHLSFSTVTTHYYPSSNEFVCPMAGMQSPFYQFGLPWSLNMGAIGSVIAHEMTHGFTGRGSYYDADGNLRPIRTNSEYNTKTECFVQQYGNITDEERNITINGEQTLDENIADNSGLALAYAAYKRMVEEDCGNTTTTLESLPGFTGPQLFFIANGMSWCSVVKADSFLHPAPYMRYSPSKYRVNLPMQNLPEFATAFNCSSESAMYKNSTETCSLWRPTLTTE